MTLFTFSRKSAGMALLEPLIALVVVTVGFLGILKFQATLVVASAESKSRATAMHLAQEKIEALHNLIAETEHTLDVTACTTPGSWTGDEDITLGNNTFTRTWTVTPDCTQLRNTLNVNVGWADARGDHNVHLAAMIAWADPGAGLVRIPATGGGGLITKPTSNAVRGDMNADYASVPEGATANSDGTYTYVNDDGTYELIIKDEDEAGYRIAISSGHDFIKLSGMVMIHTESSPNLTTLCGAVLPLPSDVGYCAFPLNISGSSPNYTAGTAINCNASPAPAAVKVAAYNCYVGEGWFGNLSLYNLSESSYFDGTNTVGGDKACPEYGTEAAKSDGWIPGSRSHKALKLDDSNEIVGQSGMLPAYESALTNLNFIVYKNYSIIVGSGGNKKTYTINRCEPTTTLTATDVGLLETRALTDKTGANPQYIVLQENDSSQDGTTTSVTFTPATFKPYDYIAAYVHSSGTATGTQTVDITGSISLGTGATTPIKNVSVSATSSSCSTTLVNGDSTATYKCTVDPGADGWTGSVTLNTVASGDYYCPPTGTTYGGASYTSISSNQASQNFTIKLKPDVNNTATWTCP